jgi:Tc5 transposase DNA-binding domain/CENP-B N-terminal DNA-binding domain
MKRTNYTIKQKLDVLREHQPGVKGRGVRVIAKEHNIQRDTIKAWLTQKDQLWEAIKIDTYETPRDRRLKGGGRQVMYADLEKELKAWIVEKNQKGLRVKDQYIQQKALSLFKSRKNNQAGDDERYPVGNSTSPDYMPSHAERCRRAGARLFADGAFADREA